MEYQSKFIQNTFGGWQKVKMDENLTAATDFAQFTFFEKESLSR